MSSNPAIREIIYKGRLGNKNLFFLKRIFFFVSPDPAETVG